MLPLLALLSGRIADLGATRGFTTECQEHTIMNSKYAPLGFHLRDSGRTHVPMTFNEIEHVIGAPLPPAALKHRALWSNNPDNWVMTEGVARGRDTKQRKSTWRNDSSCFGRP